MIRSKGGYRGLQQQRGASQLRGIQRRQPPPSLSNYHIGLGGGEGSEESDNFDNNGLVGVDKEGRQLSSRGCPCPCGGHRNHIVSPL